MEGKMVLNTTGVLNRLSVSRSTLYLLMKEDGFPKPFKMRLRANSWYLSDVDAWVANKTLA